MSCVKIHVTLGFFLKTFNLVEEWKEKPVYKPVERYSFWKGKQTEVENDLTLRKDFIPLRTDVGHAVSGGGP